MRTFRRANTYIASAFSQCIETIKKPASYRASKDTEKMIPYLMSLKELVGVFKTENDKIIPELLSGIALALTYSLFRKNEIIFRYGEKGNKFYILLQGDVGVLIPKAEKVHMNEDEYILYLLKLRRNNEIELLNKCIGLNNGNFLINNENFDAWMKAKVASQANVVSKPPEFGFLSKKSTKMINFDFESSKKITYTGPSDVVIEKIKETIEYIGMEEQIKLKNKNDPISIEKYIAMNQLDLAKNLPTDSRKLVTIFQYQHVNTLTTGATFGDIALESRSQKRSATLIAMLDTHLGTLDKTVYDKLLRVINDKSKKLLTNLIFSYPIFNDISKSSFEKQYYLLFKYQKLRQGEKILLENSPGDCIYFIKTGEYEIYTRKNILEVNELLSIFHKKLSFYNGDDPANSTNVLPYMKLLNENADIREKIKYTTPIFKKIFFEKKIIRLGIIKDREIVGLDECFNSETKDGLMTVECLSNSCEAYVLSRESYSFIKNKERVVQVNCEKFMVAKIKFFIDRLLHYKKTQTNDYLKNGELEEVDLSMNEIAYPEKNNNIELSSSRLNENCFAKGHSFGQVVPKELHDNKKISRDAKISSYHQIESTMMIDPTEYSDKKTPNFRKLTIRNKILQSDRAVKSSQKMLNSFRSHLNTAEKKEEDSYLNSYKSSIIQKNRYNDLFKTFLNENPLQRSGSALHLQVQNSLQKEKQKLASARSPFVESHCGRNLNLNLNYVDPLIKDKLDRYYSTISSSMKPISRSKVYLK